MSEPRPVAVIVLAAGEGTRMKSRIPKVLHSLCGRSMLGHALAAAGELDPQRLVVVVGHGRDQVGAEAARHAPGRARGRAGAAGRHRPRGPHGDRGARRPARHRRRDLRRHAAAAGADAGRAGPGARRRGKRGNRAHRAGPDPSGYGRIIRDDDGSLAEIVEEADATAAQRAIDEINSGCYAFDGALLADAVKRVATSNAQGQEYLTDVVAILRGDGHPAGTVLAADPAEIQGVNDRVQLAQARRATTTGCSRTGCGPGSRSWTRRRPGSTWTSPWRRTRRSCPGPTWRGRRRSGTGARIGPDCLLRDTVGRRRTRRSCYAVCESAEIGPGADVGPFARLRPGTRIGPGRAHRHLRRAEERHGRRGLQGAAPDLRGRRRHRRALQHRRGHDLRELRRRGQAPHDGGGPRSDRQRHHAGRAGDDRGRRLHGGRVGDHRGRARRARSASPAAGSTTPRGGSSGGARARRGRGGRARPQARRTPKRPGAAGPGRRRLRRAEDEGRGTGERHDAVGREEDDARLRPGLPRAGRGGGRVPGHRADADQALRLRQRRDLRPLPGFGPRLRRVRAAEPHRRPSTSGSWSS